MIVYSTGHELLLFRYPEQDETNQDNQPGKIPHLISWLHNYLRENRTMTAQQIGRNILTTHVCDILTNFSR